MSDPTTDTRQLAERPKTIAAGSMAWKDYADALEDELRRVEERNGWLVARCNDLAIQLDRAIATLDYVGGADLIVEELRQVFYAESAGTKEPQ